MTVGGGNTGGQPNRSRRTLLRQAGAAALAAASVTAAGCLGGDGDSGDGSGEVEADGGSGEGETGGGDGGSDDQPDISGQLQVSETVSEDTEWEFDLVEGQTMTAVFESDSYSDGLIYEGESVAIMDDTNITPDDSDVIQYTAEKSQMYRVMALTEDPVDVEIYVTSA